MWKVIKSSDQWEVSGSGLSPGDWNHVVVTWSPAAGAAVYIDCHVVGEAASPVGSSGGWSNGYWSLGCVVVSDFIVMILDQLSVWTTVLSVDEVSVLYSQNGVA